jgi:hypothetical protein
VIIICADAARFAAASLRVGPDVSAGYEETLMKTRSLLSVAFGFVVSFSRFAGPKSPMSRITSRGGTATYKYTGKYLGPCDKKKDE